MVDVAARKHTWEQWVRLVLGGLTLAASLFVILPPPTAVFWKVGIFVTEWGHWLTLVALLPLWPGWRRSWRGRSGVLLSLCAMVLFLSPLIRAIPLTHQIPVQLAEAFGDTEPSSGLFAPPRPAPLVPVDLFRGVQSPEVSFSSQTYFKNENYELTLDLYQPSHSRGLVPGVIVIHGGSWNSGDANQLTSLNHYLAARGYIVAAINYRLAPKWSFPAPLEDVDAAIRFLTDKASTLGLDPQRLVLLGRSAGGQLALLAGYTMERRSIRGVVAFYTPADLLYAYTHPGNPALIDTIGVIEAYLGGGPDRAREAYKAASPFQFVKSTTPPTLLIHGAQDALVWPAQSERLSRRLSDRDAPHFYLRLPWATHGCDYNFSGPCGQITTFTIERFLTAVMR